MENFNEWTACEFNGHVYESSGNVRRCADCGDSYEEDDDPRRYMGSDSDFSDRALGIDY